MSSNAAAAQRVAQPHPLAGFSNLLRFTIRRDRVRGPIWIAAVVGIVTLSADSVIRLYSTPADIESYAAIAQADAAIKALTGPGYGLDNPTQGAVVMNEVGLYTLIAIALMCSFMVTRHTRAEEETDRAELVRAAPVGRYATLLAACVWVTVLNVTIAAGVTLGLIGTGLATTGSVAFGAACFGLGLFFTSLAAVAAQMGSTSRAANAGAGAALGIFFVLRAVGDMGNGWMRWLSPLGWAQAIRPYADERWWVLAPLLIGAVVLAVVAVRLVATRDLGAGFIKQRPGPAHAGPRLSTPLALVARLQRTALIGWTAGLALTAFFFGIVADQADELMDNQAIADMLAASGLGTPAESFLATTVLMTALMATGFAVSSVLRARTEEFGFRLDPILASPVTRTRWLVGYLIVSLGGTALIMTLSGLMTGLGYALQVGDASEILPLIQAGLSMVPALAVLSTIAIALVGIQPRWAMGAWATVAFTAVVGLLAETLNLPDWARQISPFTHVPAIPAESFDILPLLALSAVAVGFALAGWVGMNRRDIARR